MGPPAPGPGALHPGEPPLTLAAVRALLAEQHPDLAHLPLRPMGQAGTDNVLYRLGADLVLRFPRLPHVARQIAPLASWLPGLAPALGLAVPRVLRLGRPGQGYPFDWAICAWIAGRPGAPTLSDPAPARALARALRALQAQPVPPATPARLGDTVPARLSALEALIPRLAGADTDRLLALLHRLRALAPPPGPPVWTHGDLHPLNWLMRRGRLVALIDWGNLAPGDAAIDLLPAFFGLDGAARTAFLAEMAPDAAALDRARAIALSKLVHGLPYYRASNPAFHAILRAGLPRLWLD